MKIDLIKLCGDVDLDIGDLVSTNRTKGVALKKQAVYYRLRMSYGLSWTEIADLCHKDHSTIIHGVAAFERTKDLISLTEALL